MDERDAAILDAAAELFAEGGLGAVTIRALGERAGASTGSIYHRFGDRGAILVALCVRAFEQGAAALASALADDPDGPEGMRALVRAWVDWVLAHPDQARLVYEIPTSPDIADHRAALGAAKAPTLAPLLAWVSRQVAAGALGAWPAWAWDPVVLGPAHELCRRWLADRSLPLAESREALAEACLRVAAPVNRPAKTPIS